MVGREKEKKRKEKKRKRREEKRREEKRTEKGKKHTKPTWTQNAHMSTGTKVCQNIILLDSQALN